MQNAGEEKGASDVAGRQQLALWGPEEWGAPSNSSPNATEGAKAKTGGARRYQQGLNT